MSIKPGDFTQAEIFQDEHCFFLHFSSHLVAEDTEDGEAHL